jgi:hypothetical protein
MNILTTTLFASIAMAATSFAGHEVVSSGKEYKGGKEPAPTYCFNAGELQLDVYGAYVVGEGPAHAGPVRDHGFGGGIGVNYFFTRYLGVGAEGYWISADHNARAGDGRDNGDTTFHNVNGSLIFRLPIDALCLAPYAYLGGGAVMDGDKWAVGFAGVGLEYRVIPNKLGLFVDARWNYYGDRYGADDQNNFTSRAGVRWVF